MQHNQGNPIPLTTDNILCHRLMTMFWATVFIGLRLYSDTGFYPDVSKMQEPYLGTLLMVFLSVTIAAVLIGPYVGLTDLAEGNHKIIDVFSKTFLISHFCLNLVYRHKYQIIFSFEETSYALAPGMNIWFRKSSVVILALIFVQIQTNGLYTRLKLVRLAYDTAFFSVVWCKAVSIYAYPCPAFWFIILAYVSVSFGLFMVTYFTLPFTYISIADWFAGSNVADTEYTYIHLVSDTFYPLMVYLIFF